MTIYSQSEKPAGITTPAGEDAALLVKLQGVECISELFHFHLDLLAPAPLPFDKLLGQPASIRLAIPGSPSRHIHGILSSLEECEAVPGPEGPATFLRYRAELVPSLWMLGRRQQSRVFQEIAVPDLLRKILRDEWGLALQMRLRDTYSVRDYCVQYVETDLAFVRRQMEEAGICFYFEHTADEHTLILADHIEGHPELDGASTLLYESMTGGSRSAGRVRTWRKRQSLRATTVRMRDHFFQVPKSTLEAISHIKEHVQVGEVEHVLNLKPLARTELYAHSEGYGWRFDGISPGGDEQPDRLQMLFKDNERITRLRMEEEATHAVTLEGESDCGHLLPGRRFTFAQHPRGNGQYLVRRVEHHLDLEATYLASAGPETPLYSNRFAAHPAALPFRPPRVTPRPLVGGYHNAIVVGPPGNDLFVDKYGRVKVKFYWDRNEQTGPMNSCWLRVSQPWAGNRWGAFFWPRVGHEVVVSFLAGNPDRPVVLGSVYNESNMPPFELPANRRLAGIKSFTSTGSLQALGDPLTNFNGLVFNDDRGSEQLELHGEKHIAFFGEHSHRHSIDGWHEVNVNGVHRVRVGALPGGSGSGGGFTDTGDTPFVYDGHVGSGRVGVSLSATCGLEESVVLGVCFSLVVGQEFNLVMNPAGMLTDLAGVGGEASALSRVMSSIVNPVSSLAGGDTDLYMGTYNFSVYGQIVYINRSSRTTISSDINWGVKLSEKDPKLTPAEIWAAISQTLALLASSYTMAVTVAAAARVYTDANAALWDAMRGAGEALAETLVDVDTIIGTWTQLTSALNATAADALVDDENALRKLAVALNNLNPVDN
ncbi:MAG: type VI secretion system tip protein TssI/VgrG [Gemmataceae bacterium]